MYVLLLLIFEMVGTKYLLTESACDDCSIILHEASELDHLSFANRSVVIYNCDTLNGTLPRRPSGGNFLDVQLSHRSCGFSNNFEGRVLSALFLDILPFCQCKRFSKDGTICVDATGYEWRTLEVVAGKLNFSVRLTATPASDIDAKIGLVKEGRHDFLIGGVTASYKRYSITPLSTYMDFDNFAFLYVCRQSPWLQFKFLVMPFQWKVWIATLVLVVVISFSLRCILFRHGSISFLEALQDCTKALIEENVSSLRVERIRSQVGAFITYAVLLFFGIVISTAYRTVLTSMCIKPPHSEPSSLQELIEQNYEISVSTFNRQLLDEILEGDDSLLRHVKSTAVYLPRMCDQVTRTVERRSAMFNEKILLLHRSQLSCNREMFPPVDVPNYSPYKLRITKKNLRLNPHAWAINPALRLWKHISVVVAYLNCGGLIERWVEDADREMSVRLKIPYARNNFPEENVVEFEMYCTLVLFVGHTLALLAFFVELFRHRSERSHSVL